MLHDCFVLLFRFEAHCRTKEIYIFSLTTWLLTMIKPDWIKLDQIQFFWRLHEACATGRQSLKTDWAGASPARETDWAHSHLQGSAVHRGRTSPHERSKIRPLGRLLLGCWTGAPVVLHKGGLVSDGRQVHLGPADVRHGDELPDDVVSHLPHETERLAVVAPRGENLVQPGQVLFQAHLHAFQRASHLGGTQNRSHNPKTMN